MTFTTENVKPIEEQVIDILKERRKLVIKKDDTNYDAVLRMSRYDMAFFLNRVCGQAWLAGVHGMMYEVNLPQNPDEWLEWLAAASTKGGTADVSFTNGMVTKD